MSDDPSEARTPETELRAFVRERLSEKPVRAAFRDAVEAVIVEHDELLDRLAK